MVKIAVVLPLPQLGVEQADDGHSGLRTDEIRNRLHNWLAGNANDRALMHVAANNVLQCTSITAAGDKLSKIVDVLHDANPSLGICWRK